VDGTSRLAIALLLLVFASFLVDRTIRMDRVQRAFCLTLSLSGLGVLAYRRLVRPVRRALPDEVLALRIEARHPELAENLLAAVQFGRMGRAPAVNDSPPAPL
jgi:hypothetical protein